MRKVSEIRKITGAKLKKELLDLRKEQFNLRFQRANLSLENPARLKTVRREIARIKTILNEQKNA